MAEIAELVFSQNSASRVLICFAYLDQPFMRTKYINFVFLTVFFFLLQICFLFDTYFDTTAMTGNMQLFSSAQRKIQLLSRDISIQTD